MCLKRFIYTCYANLRVFIYSTVSNLCISKTLWASPTVARQPILIVKLCCNFHCISISLFKLFCTAANDSELFERKRFILLSYH